MEREILINSLVPETTIKPRKFKESKNANQDFQNAPDMFAVENDIVSLELMY